MEVFILMQVRRKELTNERRTRAWQNCMVQDKRLELLSVFGENREGI